MKKLRLKENVIENGKQIRLTYQYLQEESQAEYDSDFGQLNPRQQKKISEIVAKKFKYSLRLK